MPSRHSSRAEISRQLNKSPNWLSRAIEELRFKNREAARLEVERFVVRLVNSETAPARIAELCRALCIWASIQRTSQRPELASVALCWSLRATECLGLRITSAHLRQRSSYLLRDTGHPVQAKTMLESSILDFVQAGSWSDVARCLVDRACLELQLSRPDQAERNASAALRMLEPAQWRNLAIAHQVLAETALTRNDTRGALGHLDNAVDAHRDRRDEVLFGHLLWSRGRLHSELGNDDAAITDYHQALALIAKNGMPLDVALLALQLAQSLLRLGKTREICALAEQVQGMTPLFRGAPLADGVLMEFVRIVRYDSLSMVFLSRCLERIQVGGPEDPP